MRSAFILSERARDGALRGARDALPIVLAYFPVAATFGVLATGAGLPIWITALISLMIYAGASQFMLVSLYAAGVEPVSLALTVVLVNLRHLLYGTTLGQAVVSWRERQKWVAGFGLTDEVFAVTGTRALREPPTPAYQYALSFASYGAWVGGTLVGALVGHIVPPAIATVLAFALPALFLSLLVSQVRHGAHLAAAVCGGAAALVAQQMGSASVGIVVGALAGATAGLFVARWRGAARKG